MQNMNRCLNSGDCRQYCAALDDIASEGSEDPCSWPERVESGYDFVENTNGELGNIVAGQLQSVLNTGNSVRSLLEAPGNELHAAYRAQVTVFDTQLELWRSYAEAARQQRSITDVEVDYYTSKLRQHLESAGTDMRQAGVSLENLTLAQAMHDRRTLEDYGLLFDENMLQAVTQLCASSAAGQSTLLIGDKGVAKTQAAKFVSALYAPDGRPRIISGDGSMMKDEFIGKPTLTEENGATVTTFQPGILTECMTEGIPLVMDEINLIDPAIAMRLQDILLRKPGSIINLQEDGGMPITIKQGFCVLATANEASSRYQSRAALDPAFRDRFSVLPIEYPDGDTIMLQAHDRPASLARLAYSHVVSRNGITSRRVTPNDALWLASVAHASQQLYSKAAKDVNTGLLGTRIASVVDDSEPRMTDCITPRKLVGIIQTVADGLNPYDVAAGVKGLTMDTVAAMQQSDDRQTMYEVMRLMHDGRTGTFDEAAIKKRLRI